MRGQQQVARGSEKEEGGKGRSKRSEMRKKEGVVNNERR